MKNIRNIVALLALSCAIAPGIWAVAPGNVNFGSRDSGFIASSGTLALGTITLRDGSLRDVGGTITGTVTASGLTLETKDDTTTRKMTTDGTVVIGTSVSLGNNQVLTVNGGTIVEDITIDAAAATPAIIQGFGSFDAVIAVNDDKQVNMRWNGSLNQNINLNASAASVSRLKLEQDLYFGVGKFISAGASDTSGGSIDFNGYKIVCGGDETTVTSIDRSQSWINPNISLSGPLEIADDKVVTFANAGYISGKGSRLSFAGISAAISNGGYSVTFEDVILAGLSGSSLVGSGDWTFVHTILAGDSGSVLIDGSITSSEVNVFAGTTTFGASTINLLTDLKPSGTWTLDGNMIINGRGNVFNCGGSGKRFALGTSSLRLENITFAQVASESIDANSSSGRTMYLSNVNWLGSNGNSIFVMGTDRSLASQGAAELLLPQNSEAGDIFSLNSTWSNGAHIELLSDVALACTWTFSQNSEIDGRGKHLDLSAGVLKISKNKTLTLRNIVLDNVSNTSCWYSVGEAGTINLSNVTIILGAADVTWNGTIVVDGPLTVVTSSHIFTGEAMTLDGITAYYDTLSTTDSNNLIVATLSNDARVMCIKAPVAPVSELIISGDTALSNTMYLYPSGDGDGCVISCLQDAILNGNGRSLIFPYTNGVSGSTSVVSIASGKVLKTTNIIFEGFVPSQHVEATGTLLFGDDTTVRLHQDIALTKTLTFGTSDGASSEQMVFDLSGHTINMNDDLAEIILQGSVGNTLCIKNGRIINLSGTKISAEEGTVVTFENVEIALSEDATWENAGLYFEGNCIISGKAGKVFNNTSMADIKINTQSQLTILDGIVYSHNNSGTMNFKMADESSKLELIGATFRHPDTAAQALTLLSGTLLLDHKSYIQPGAEGLIIYSDVRVEVRPGATLNVTSAEGIASAGTLSFT